MKRDMLPLYRDGDRLMVVRYTPFAQAGKSRLSQIHVTARQAMRARLWPQARYWKAVPFGCWQAAHRHSVSCRDQEVADAWQRLGQFSGWSTVAVADALYVLIETPAVPLYAGSSGWETCSDPRPALADRAWVRQWLLERNGSWENIITRLVREGRLEGEAAIRLMRHRPTPERCIDPHALVHFRCTADMLTITWNADTVRSVLPWCRGGSLSDVRSAEQLFERHTEDIRFRQVAGKFLENSVSSTIAPWWRRAAWMRDRGRMALFLEQLADSPARLRSPHRISVRLVQQMERKAGWKGMSALPVSLLLDLVTKGRDPALLEEIAALIGQLGTLLLIWEWPEGMVARPDLAKLMEFGEVVLKEAGHTASSRRWIRDDVWRLYEAALTSPALCRTIQTSSWRDFGPGCARDWCHLMLNFRFVKDQDRCLGRYLDRMRRAILREQPEHQKLMTKTLSEVFYYHDEIPSESVLCDATHFASTVARGFSELPENAVEWFGDMIKVVSTDQRRSLANVSRSTIKQIELATRSRVDQDLIVTGAKAWFAANQESDPAIVFRRPRRFLKTLRRLGRLPENVALEICRYFQDHPGFCIDPLRIDPREACFLFDHLLRPGQQDPVPDKLRDHACGRIALGQAAMHHYRETFAGNLADYQLDRVAEEITRHENSKRVSGLDPHTLNFLATMGSQNKRSLKRFVQALRAGESDWRESHPANRLWLKRHPQVASATWLKVSDLVFPVSLPGIASAHIQIEDDPQEELKMGTYFSTCLGLGGCNQHGAVANTLDINKRVAYLKDSQGRRLARQLVAISENDELVVFDIYDRFEGKYSRECQQAFHVFDRHLARRLGIPLRSKEADYEIKPLVVRSWYDDGAWDGCGESVVIGQADDAKMFEQASLTSSMRHL